MSGIRLRATSGALTGTVDLDVQDGSDPFAVEAPRTLFTSPYVPGTGTVRTVNSGGDLQAALNAAVPGDVIVLETGAVFTGNFSLPTKTGNGGVIQVVSAAIRGGTFPVPFGTRVTSSAGMSTIRHPNGNVQPIVATVGNGKTGWRFGGIQFDLPPTGAITYGGGDSIFDLVRLGVYNPANADPDAYPGNIVFDRCRAIGREDANVRRGIAFSGPDGGVFDSQILRVNTELPVGDSVGIVAWLAARNLHFYNVEIEGPTEHIFPGGVLNDNWTANTQIVPTDITVDRCYLKGGAYQDEQDPAWNGRIYNTKNFLETKAGLRVRFRRTLCDRHLGKDQQFCMTIKSNGGGGLGGGSNHPTRDITIEDMKFTNWMGGIQFRGVGTTADNPLERIRVRNVGMVRHRAPAGRYTVNPRVLQFQNTIRNVDISQLTGLLGPAGEWAMMAADLGTDMTNLRLRDSILGGFYGIGFAGDPWGGWPTSATGQRVLERLGLVDPSNATNYGNASNRRVANAAAAQFASYANATNDNLRLLSGSPLKGIGQGGADPGCDWDALDAATAGCISGVWT
jgi:hypothetical protein